MSITKYLPLGISDYWFGSTAIASNAMLLRDDVTSIPETVKYTTDLNTYEVSTGGGYTAGGSGMAGPDLNRIQDAATGVVEYDCGTQLWQTTASLTVANFQWVVIASGTTPLVIWDLGASTSLSGSQLTLELGESPYIAGNYPVLRFKRNTA